MKKRQHRRTHEEIMAHVYREQHKPKQKKLIEDEEDLNV